MTATAPPLATPEVPLDVREQTRHPIGAFVLRRVAGGLVTLLAASFFIFVATNVLPGNVAQVVLGKNASPETVAVLEQRLGLHRSFFERYGTWLGHMMTGDLGVSAVELAQNASAQGAVPETPISNAIAAPVRNSLILAGLTIVLLIPLSLVLGVVAGVYAGTARDYIISMTSLVLGAFPEFVFGTVLILIFFSEFHLLPPLALVPPGDSPLNHFNSLILPILTLLGVTLASCVRQVRAGMIEVLQREYVTVARINGLPRRRVLWRYALRNALAASVQIISQNILYLIGGIIIVENVFTYPGLGTYLVNAVGSRDVTAVEAVAVMLAALYISINILADLIVVLLVPKLRTGTS
jgi:peptide/nickel transport system permease protein